MSEIGQLLGLDHQLIQGIDTGAWDSLRNPYYLNSYGHISADSYHKSYLDYLLNHWNRRVITDITIGENNIGKTTSMMNRIIKVLTDPQVKEMSERSSPPAVFIIEFAQLLEVVAPTEKGKVDLVKEGVLTRVSQAATLAFGEARRTAQLYPGPTLIFASFPTVTLIGLPEGYPEGEDRCYSVIRTLSADGSVFYNARVGNPELRKEKMDFRTMIREAKNEEEKRALIEKSGITFLTDKGEKEEELIQFLVEIGAPSEMAHEVSRKLHRLMFKHRELLKLPEAGFPIDSAAVFTTHPEYKIRCLMEAFYPYMFRDDFQVPPERVFIGLQDPLEEVSFPKNLYDRFNWVAWMAKQGRYQVFK